MSTHIRFIEKRIFQYKSGDDDVLHTYKAIAVKEWLKAGYSHMGGNEDGGRQSSIEGEIPEQYPSFVADDSGRKL